MDTTAQNEYILELIKKPQKANDDDVEAIKHLVDQYPYFHALRILYLKLLAVNDYPEFLKELPLAAIYAGDRKNLYFYIHPKKKPGNSIAKASEAEHVEDSPFELNQTANIEEDQPEETCETNVEQSTTEPQTMITEKELMKPEEAFQSADAERTTEDEEAIHLFHPTEDDFEVPEKTEAAEIQEGINAPIELAGHANNKIELSETNENPDHAASFLTSMESSLENVQENTDEDIEDPVAEPPETLTFTDWLDSLMKPVQQDQSSVYKTMQPKQEEETTEVNHDTSESVHSIRNETVKEPKRWDLIDQFLTDYKPSEKPELTLETNYRVEDLSKTESTEDKEIVTETLAKIFITQKKYNKALAIFEKLSLKYPEKNVYFAGQIKEIKKLKKDL